MNSSKLLNKNAQPPWGSAAVELLLVLSAAVAVRVLFIVLAPAGAVSADFHSWEAVVRELEAGRNPYGSTTKLNWPPLWMQFLYFCSRIAQHFDWPLIRVVQGILIAAEAAVIILCRQFLMQCSRRFRLILLLAGISFNPIFILQVCQHGNFDLLLAVWILAFLLALMRFAESGELVCWLAACLFLGLGVLTKTVPFVLAPLLLLRIRTLPLAVSAFGTVLLLLPVSLGMSIIYALEPAGVLRNVLQYRSIAGFYGVTGLLELAGAGDVIPLYRRAFVVLLLAALAGAGAYVYRRSASADFAMLLRLALLLLMLPPTFGPGYGPQYICWYGPLLLVLFAEAGKRLRSGLLVFYGIAAATYLLEYSLFPSHGALLLWATDGAPALVELSRSTSSQGGQTLVRFPLFAAYVLLSGTLLIELRRKQVY